MKSWNSVIFIKTKSDWSDTKLISKMPGVESLWSVTGEWDWCIKLDSQHSSPEQTETFVKNLRKADWVSQTNTSWWKREAM